MAVRFSSSLEVLIADIIAGGYRVQSIQTIPDSRGRTIDVCLNNNIVVCWDSFSNVVWAEGPRGQIRSVEWYLRKIYEGPKFLRSFATWCTRSVLRMKSANHAAALWLLRSASLPARILRHSIKCVPLVFFGWTRHR
jgi:hypothetical protein